LEERRMSKHRHLYGHLRTEPRARPAGIFHAAIADCAVQAFGTILTWIERYRQRRLLGSLSDHMLKDMGVTRADVEREVVKQFWRH
jgi:uncharacterized protein YjiS (DUF1127 family)